MEKKTNNTSEYKLHIGLMIQLIGLHKEIKDKYINLTKKSNMKWILKKRKEKQKAPQLLWTLIIR